MEPKLQKVSSLVVYSFMEYELNVGLEDFVLCYGIMNGSPSCALWRFVCVIYSLIVAATEL